jgi:hypothetical protein
MPTWGWSTPPACGSNQIQLQASPSRAPRTYLRLQHGRYLVAYCRTVAEVARHVDLATLEPAPA